VAKAAGQPNPLLLWSPRQRPTLQKRNVVDHLPEEHKADVKRKLQNAYGMTDYNDAKRALERLHRELMDLNPSAARSLEEGLEETLTVHKLRVPINFVGLCAAPT
jgi:transposase-like protein